MLLGALVISLLGKCQHCKGSNRAVDGLHRAGQEYLVPSHSLTNSEIWKYYQSEPKFKGVYSWNN